MSDSEWYYLENSEQQGPVSLYVLKGHISAHQLPAEEGMAGWVAANTIPAFSTKIPVHILSHEEVQKTAAKDIILEGLSLPVELIQKHPIHGTANYILDREAMEITYGIGANRRRTRVLVTSLVQEPKRTERHHLGWLRIAVILIIVGLIVTIVGGVGVFPYHQIVGALGVVTMVSAVPFIIYMQMCAEKLLSFDTFNKPVTFWIDNPDKVTFDSFITTLLTVIESVNRSIIVKSPVYCQICEAKDVVPDFTLPLCFACRANAVKLSVPLWLQGVAIAVGLAMMVCFSQLSAQLQGEILLARGMKAEKASDFSAAEADYQAAVKEFPHSEEILFGLARSAFRSGDQAKASETVDMILKDVATRVAFSSDEMAVIKQVQEAKK
jgi:hypothetical protein